MTRTLPVEARTARSSTPSGVSTSASTVRGFVGAMTGDSKVVAIGRVLGGGKVRGLRVSAVARPHTIDGVVAALKRVLGAS